MPKRFVYSCLTLFMFLVACSDQAEPSPVFTEDFHYSQMAALAESETREVTLANLYGGVDELEGRVDTEKRLIYQGDMIIGTAGVGEQANFGRETKKWPGNTVPYVIEDTPGMGRLRNQIKEAVEIYNRETNIRWVERTDEPYYVLFVHDEADCSSYVGLVEGKLYGEDQGAFPEGAQPIRLTDMCGLWGALHEIGHAIGLHHEHSRSDRNDYIELNCGIIKREYNSECDGLGWGITEKAEPYGDYDFYSIMHYAACKRYYYRNGGESCTEVDGDGNPVKSYQVISPLKEDVDLFRMGRGYTLTDADTVAVNYLYPELTEDKEFSGAVVAYHSGKCLDVPRSAQNVVQLIQYTCHGDDNQIFDLKRVEGKPDIYTMRNRVSGKCVDIAPYKHDDGVPVMQAECTGAKNQQFELRAKPNGTYQIAARHTQKCLDIVDGSTANRAKVQQRYCYARPENIVNQTFYLEELP